MAENFEESFVVQCCVVTHIEAGRSVVFFEANRDSRYARCYLPSHATRFWAGRRRFHFRRTGRWSGGGKWAAGRFSEGDSSNGILHSMVGVPPLRIPTNQRRCSAGQIGGCDGVRHSSRLPSRQVEAPLPEPDCLLLQPANHTHPPSYLTSLTHYISTTKAGTPTLQQLY